MRDGIRRNSKYYRTRRYIRDLVSNPLRYYLFYALKNYPHTYSKNYSVKLARANEKKENRPPVRISEGVVNVDASVPGTSGYSTGFSPTYASTPRRKDARQTLYSYGSMSTIKPVSTFSMESQTEHPVESRSSILSRIRESPIGHFLGVNKKQRRAKREVSLLDTEIFSPARLRSGRQLEKEQ